MKQYLIMAMALTLVSSAVAVGVFVGPFSDRSESAAVREDASFYNALGYKLAQDGDMVSAQAMFTRAVELDPMLDNARSNLAVTAYGNEDYLTAIDELRVLTERRPMVESYRFDLAQNLVHQARFVDTEGSVAGARLEEAAAIYEELGTYPHAAENAQIVRTVIAEATA